MATGSAPNPPLIGILTGVTAAGKTSIALELAAGRSGIEIVNADSLLVYRGLDIGTAKPTQGERAGIPHHLIDIRAPDEAFTAGDFARLANAAIDEIHARGNRALVVGGTGFYLKALLHGIWEGPGTDPTLRERLALESNDALYARLEARDPKAALRIGRNDQYRLIRSLELIELGGKSPSELEAEEKREPDPRFRLWILDRETAELERRIALRTHQMLEAGLVEETRALLERFPSARPLGSVGYAQTIAFLKGEPPEGRKIRAGLEGLADEITLATRQLVKRQRTWFKGQHPEGVFFQLDRDAGRLQDELKSVYG
jgi:tRNA dimethylallyltransferase